MASLPPVRFQRRQSGEAVLIVGAASQAFRWLAPGTFTDLTGRTVTLTTGAWLGTTPMTQGFWEALWGEEPPCVTTGAEHPVDSVSWHRAQESIARLNAAGAGTFRCGLPSEARWEQAWAAGGLGDVPRPLEAYAWHAENSGRHSQPVGTLRPDGAGFHDLLGNLWEWCADWSGPLPPGPVVDPTGPADGVKRVVRGGSYSIPGAMCQASRRGGDPPEARLANVGFRLCLEAHEAVPGNS